MSGSYDGSSEQQNSDVVSNSNKNNQDSEENQEFPSNSGSNNDDGQNINFGNNLLVFKNPNKIKFQSRSKKDPLNERKQSLKHPELEEKPEDKEEEASKNLRQIFDKFFSIGKRMFYIQLYISILSLLSFAFYVLCTYDLSYFAIMNYLDLFVSFCYFVEYGIHIILAHHRMVYLISLNSIINILTMLPNLFSFLSDDYTKSFLYSFINCTRVLRVLRIFRIFYLVKNEENNVNRQILMIINTLTQLIFIVAGIVQIVEYNEIEKRLLITKNIILINNLHMRTQFHHYLYFIIITVSTVGYGDIYPYTTLGKLIFMIFVLLIIVLIPYQTNDLIQWMSAQSDYARSAYKASKDIQHIVLIGDISIDSLRSFCWEFFHPDHGVQYRHAIILNMQIPSREMEIFLNEKANENFLFYWQGDPLCEKDLLRADIPKAKACIIFNNKNSKDPHTGDHQSLFLGIFIKKFVYTYNSDLSKAVTDMNDLIFYSNPFFHLCMQLNKPESSCHYFNTLQPMYKKNLKQDQLIVIESIKMNWLSKSCLTPGIMALITNLVMSAGDAQIKNEEAEWMKEYAEGRGHEIYRIQLQNYYKNMNFLEVTESVYNQEQAIVFALEIEISGVSIVKLNPTSTMKLIEIINKSKDINSSDKTKESGKNNNNNSIASEASSHDRSKEKITVINNMMESKVKIYAYLICSDKAVADRISCKDKHKEKGNNTINVHQGRGSCFVNNTNQIFVYNKDQDLGQSIAVHNQNNNNRSISKSIPIQNHWNMNSAQSDSDEEEDEDSGNEEIMQFGSSDWDFNKNDYYFNDSQDHYLRNNIEIMHHSIKDREDITNHIIICGLHPALVHFILPLRAKYLQEDALKWIVILAPSLPQHLFEAFTKFRRIIFIQGSPWLPENWFRANILNADKAVILSSGESKVVKVFNQAQIQTSTLHSEEQMLDAETIFIYKAIQKCNKNIQIMTELIYTNNIEYLLNTSNLQKLFYKQEEVPQYEFTPIYASGEVFTPSIVDRITCQSFYNPHIVTIIELILGGERALSTHKSKKWDDFYKFHGSNLYLIKIPDPYINEAFGDFFYFLIRNHNTVSIALYRKNIIENFYYVYTNPKKTTWLRDCDFAFVLSNTNNILDLVDDKPVADNRDGASVKSESDSWIEDDNPSAALNLKERLSILSKMDNSNIQKRNRKKEVTKQSIIDQSKSDIKNFMSEDTIINQWQFTMKQKQIENSKHAEIERLQTRLNNIKQDLNAIKENFVELPKYIDKIIDKEMDSEMKVYLSKI